MRAFAQAPSAESTKGRNGSTFSFGVLAAILACVAAFLGIGAPAAMAVPEAGPAWNYKLTFGLEGNVVGPFNATRNEIALDSSGNIFSQLSNSSVIAVYKPSPTEGGEFLTFAVSGPILVNLAIDPSDDALYADGSKTNGEPEVIRRWLSDGQPTPTYTLDPSFEVPQGDGFAIDPATHDVLVTDSGSEAVRRYDDTGTLVEVIATPSINPSWILMMADGSFYVASESGPDLTHFSGGGTLLGTIPDVGTLHGLSFDPVRELIVASVGDQIDNYSLAGALVGSSPSHGGGISTVVDSAGQLYEETGGGPINLYGPGVQPGVEKPVASEVVGHSAHIEAEVEPGEEGGAGEAPPGSKATLEYSADGGQNWKAFSERELTESGVAVVEGDLTGLLANLEYQVRVVATNAAGNSATSDPASFSTPELAPDVETNAATSLGETTAILNGTVNPNSLQTTYHFEYGTTTAYGSRAPVADAVAGNQRTSRSFGASVSGLDKGTTYHYRIVASNSVGESTGADRTFTTAGTGDAASPRAYELVTPVDKRGAQVANDLHFQAAPGGSAIAVNVSAGPSDGNSALIRQSYVMWRGADGWSDWVNADAPQDADPTAYYEASTLAISEDFTKALVASNRALAPGGIAGGGNLYIEDLKAGTYTFVGGALGGPAYAQLAGLSVSTTVFVAAAPDFSWILFRSGALLMPGAEEAQLYRWTPEDGLTLESRLPDGSIPGFVGLLAVTQPNDQRIRLPLASADGSVVAFDLNKYFQYQIGGVYVRINGQSTPISVSHRAGDDPSQVQAGTVDWVTPTGRYVFFHTLGSVQLTNDTPAPSGPENLYRYDTESQELIYISPLIPSFSTVAVTAVSDDGQTVYLANQSETVVWHEGQVNSVAPASLISFRYATENGRYFAWIASDGQVHLYDREAGEAVCVSCPTIGSSLGEAHLVPGQRGLGNVSPRAVLENGTMFFDTPNPLLPADHNGKRDVYSYKNGFLTLISPGNENFDATFVDASRDGKDVFFQTQQGILPQDVDGSFDVYDARVGGGFPQQPTKIACSGEGCRGPIDTAPEGSAIGSAAGGRNQGSKPALSGLKSLSASDRARLATGKVAHLKLRVSGPGKVQVLGVAAGVQVIKASKQAKQAGALSVPIKLSKKGLKALKRKGLLSIRLTASLGGGERKVTSVTLKSADGKKGGSK